MEYQVCLLMQKQNEQNKNNINKNKLISTEFSVQTPVEIHDAFKDLVDVNLISLGGVLVLSQAQYYTHQKAQRKLKGNQNFMIKVDDNNDNDNKNIRYDYSIFNDDNNNSKNRNRNRNSNNKNPNKNSNDNGIVQFCFVEMALGIVFKNYGMVGIVKGTLNFQRNRKQ
eukprot:Pgem_evm1s9621